MHAKMVRTFRSLAQLGQLDEARVHADLTKTWQPNWTISKDFIPSVPHLLPDQIDKLIDGLKKAGLPY